MSRWRISSRDKMMACYRDINVFLSDMRGGTLKEGFSLTTDVWNGLVEMVNSDRQIAREIMDNGVPMLMAVSAGFEINGLMALAEVCCERDTLDSE